MNSFPALNPHPLPEWRGNLRSTLSAAEHIEANCGYQNAAFDYVLRPTFDIQERHAVVQAGENQRAQHRAEHSAATAHQTRAADYARSDRVKFHQRAGVGRTTADARRVQDRSESGQRAHYTKCRENVSLQIDS